MDLLHEMLQISRAELSILERKNIEQADLEELTACFDDRQQVMQHIDRLRQQEKEVAGETANQDEWISVLTSIQANDSRCGQLLKQAQAATGKKMAELRVNKKAMQAYSGGDGYHKAWFFDKKK